MSLSVYTWQSSTGKLISGYFLDQQLFQDFLSQILSHFFLDPILVPIICKLFSHQFLMMLPPFSTHSSEFFSVYFQLFAIHKSIPFHYLLIILLSSFQSKLDPMSISTSLNGQNHHSLTDES